MEDLQVQICITAKITIPMSSISTLLIIFILN